MRKILLTLIAALFCTVGAIGATAMYAGGFESGVESWTKSSMNTLASSTSESRTGTHSLASTGNSAGDGYMRKSISYTIDTYIHMIAWVKNSTAGNTSLKLNGNANSATSVGTTWTRLTHTYNYTSSTGNKNTDITFRKSASSAHYVDDVVLYYDNSSTIDLTAPTSATVPSATTSSISWTNGSDAATGIENTLILRRTSGSADDLSLNDQGLYAVSATDQSGHWTVVSNSVSSAATSYSGTFSAGDRYAIVHRDYAYNYSTPTYVTVVSASCSTPAAPTAVTAGSTTSSGTTLTITDAANAASYDIYYSTSSTAPVAGTAANTTSTSKTKALTGLTASTTYYVWVRSVCDSDHKSTWTALNGSSFTTLCTSHTVTAATNNDSYGTADAASTTVCEGSTTTVTAAPKSGYSFVSWAVSGTGSSLSSTSTNPTTLTMGTANATVTATFGCATPSAPSALAASSTTSSGTTLTITDAANTNNYEIYYSTSSTAPEAGTSATATSTSKTKALTSLSASTTYYVWVRSVCDSTHKSSWTALTGSTFTTDAACTDPDLTITLN